MDRISSLATDGPRGFFLRAISIDCNVREALLMTCRFQEFAIDDTTVCSVPWYAIDFSMSFLNRSKYNVHQARLNTKSAKRWERRKNLAYRFLRQFLNLGDRWTKHTSLGTSRHILFCSSLHHCDDSTFPDRKTAMEDSAIASLNDSIMLRQFINQGLLTKEI